MDTDIRFVDDSYNEVFRIPNGGKIRITVPDGEEIIMKCEYLGDEHARLIRDGDTNGFAYHLHEFAVLNRNLGNIFEPILSQEYQFGMPVSVDKSEYDIVFSDSKEKGCIGCFRGYFGKSGREFYTHWSNRNPAIGAQNFNEEMDALITHFRKDVPLMKNRDSMLEVCTGAYRRLPDRPFYVLKAVTKSHTYYIQCYTKPEPSDLYMYCYNSKILERYIEPQISGQARNSVKPKKNKTEVAR